MKLNGMRRLLAGRRTLYHSSIVAHQDEIQGHQATNDVVCVWCEVDGLEERVTGGTSV